MKQSLIGLMAALVAASAIPAHAAIQITEVAPWSSGNSPVGKDWFELTNTGAAAVTLTGWKMDDDSASFASAAALSGITSIAAGESVICLSTGSDAVNIFNNAGVLQASVSFGASPTGTFATFDNAAGLSGTTISQLSAVGVNGAFVAVNDVNEIGSPGAIAAVPEADTYAMMLAGLGLIGAALRKRQS